MFAQHDVACLCFLRLQPNIISQKCKQRNVKQMCDLWICKVLDEKAPKVKGIPAQQEICHFFVFFSDLFISPGVLGVKGKLIGPQGDCRALNWDMSDPYSGLNTTGVCLLVIAIVSYVSSSLYLQCSPSNFVLTPSFDDTQFKRWLFFY